jgi:hypothetical protein
MQVHVKNPHQRFIIDLVPLHPHDSMPSSQTPLYLDSFKTVPQHRRQHLGQLEKTIKDGFEFMEKSAVLKRLLRINSVRALLSSPH